MSGEKENRLPGAHGRSDAEGAMRDLGGLSKWVMAARPRTLPAAVVPVIVGLSLARRFRPLDPLVAAATLAAALLIQIGTNYANDYYDFVSGADVPGRLGPTRITQAGLATPSAVKRAAFASLGLYLVAKGGWPILLVGVASLASALAYSAGPYPLASLGLGDLFVFIFFGLVAVNGAVYLQGAPLGALSLLASLPVACLVTAILVVNNVRDIPTDAQAGKRTLAVRLGERAGRLEYYVLVAGAYLALVPLWKAAGAGVMLALLSAPVALAEARAFSVRRGAALNQSLAGTARLHLIFGLLLALGLLL